MREQPKRKRAAPKGSGLSFDRSRGPTDSRGRRLGEWLWRRVDPRTGKRHSRRTGQHRLDLALRVALKFDDELRQRAAGVEVYDCWRAQLLPLVDEWIAGLAGEVSEQTRQCQARQVKRALGTLKLRTAADLTNLVELTRRLRALEGERIGRHVVNRLTLRRTWQNPLRRFSRWLAKDGRYLSRDPLANWALLKVPSRVKAPRRASPPKTVARALKALDLLDVRHRRLSPQRPLYTAMLVSAPRLSAMLSRDARDLISGERLGSKGIETFARIDMGRGRGNKRRGAGELDPTTTRELLGYLDARKVGPLFLSATGLRLTRERALDSWQEAYGLALVDELWPTHIPCGLEAAVQVNLALRRGHVQVGRGGNPRQLRSETVVERLELHKLVAAVVDAIHEEWMSSQTDLHSFRKTHRTWALAQRVPPLAIDKQLGHGGTGADHQRDELAQVLGGSRVGRVHYTDLASDLFDARLSAIAVRELLDEATRVLEAEGTTFLFQEGQPGQASTA